MWTALLAAVLAPSIASADEGMWLPEQLPQRAVELRRLGLTLDADALGDPKGQPLGSIVTLGFCSASFVSPDGLIATNHHCVSGYLQYLSDAENDRNRDGFLAASRADEQWVGPGSEVQVVDKITDVTLEVVKGVRRRTRDRTRERIVSLNQKTLVADCERDRPDVRCQVASYWGGAEYRLIEKRRLRDVRLVYAPPESVGSYGGEIDNWMWPRHSGDFAFLRVYVAPDGSAAEHSADNVPYQPPRHLEINPEGANPGDFVMVAGYPGSTYRFRRARDLRFARDVRYPFRIELQRQIIDILQGHADADPEAKARLSSSIGQLENSLKYSQGMLDGFSKGPVLADKVAAEESLMDWVEADPRRARRYGPAFAELDQIADEDERLYRGEAVVGWLLQIDLLRAAYTAWRLAGEADKPDLLRDRGYQDRDRERHARRMERMDKSLWLPSDRDALVLLLNRVMELPEEQRPTPVVELVTAWGGVEAAVAKLHDQPALAQTEARLALLDQSRDALAESDDPWVQLARALDAWSAPLRARDKQRAGSMLRLRPAYIEALRKQSGDDLYPDANGTLRVTVGNVKGYEPADGLWATPQTTVRGLAAKAGDWPFDAPERLLEASQTSADSRWVDADLGDVPVNFLTTLDTTGGNSGSATLDSQGRLVGLIFDGNYEAMSADWLFNPVLTRSIHVDIRYILWTLESVEEADWVLDELGVAAP